MTTTEYGIENIKEHFWWKCMLTIGACLVRYQMTTRNAVLHDISGVSPTSSDKHNTIICVIISFMLHQTV